MCGRFTLTWDQWRRVADALGVDAESEAGASYQARFNSAPTDPHFIVTTEFKHYHRLLGKPPGFRNA